VHRTLTWALQLCEYPCQGTVLCAMHARHARECMGDTSAPVPARGACWVTALTASYSALLNARETNVHAYTRNTAAPTHAPPQVFPKVASRPPRLLQDLEASLIERLRANDKAVSTAPLVTKDRDPGMAANLSLDAHRAVFASFTQVGGEYRPTQAQGRRRDLAGLLGCWASPLTSGYRVAESARAPFRGRR
jgi:hypothetical protein